LSFVTAPLIRFGSFFEHENANRRCAVEWRLFLRNKFTCLTVCPDEKYPGMFRIHRDGRPPSDMVNLARAKDAAVSWARPRGLSGGEQADWRQRENGLEGAPVAKSQKSVSEAA
jgi:hypothetical protein